MGVKEIVGQTGSVLNHTIKKFVQLVCEVWTGFNRSAFLYTPSGDNSVPCKKDQVLLVKITGTGKYAVIGTLTASQEAQPGEKYLFGRDPDGAIVSKIKMLNSGDINIDLNGEWREKSGGDKIIDSGGKVYIGGAENNICALLLELIDLITEENQNLIDFQTFGPPPQHKTHPETVVKLNQFKQKLTDYQDTVKALFLEST